ncbi:hypothetical protein [Achromobacter insuavis]|uniref:hypothetical protein n=1 Tax=Achromobacter insuavis TaxID=1287735 RepID=UPI001F145407|nr:hypothetical protein [Achromobacter insuavis]
MEVDDVDDKTRRNLLVVATVIVLVWILGVPLNGTLFGMISLKEVSVSRAWWCAFVVLGYLSARHFRARQNAKELKDCWKAAIKNLADDRTQLVRACWDAHLTKRKRNLRCYFDNPPCPDSTLFDRQPFYFQRPDVAKWRNWISGDLTIFWRRKGAKRGDAYEFQTGVTYFALTPTGVLWLILSWFLRRVLVPSWTALEQFVPYSLALLAAAICLGKALTA